MLSVTCFSRGQSWQSHSLIIVFPYCHSWATHPVSESAAGLQEERGPRVHNLHVFYAVSSNLLNDGGSFLATGPKSLVALRPPRKEDTMILLIKMGMIQSQLWDSPPSVWSPHPTRRGHFLCLWIRKMDLAKWGCAGIGGSAKSSLSAECLYMWSVSMYTLMLSGFHLSQLFWEPPESPEVGLGKKSGQFTPAFRDLLFAASRIPNLRSYVYSLSLGTALCTSWACCIPHSCLSFILPLEEEGSRLWGWSRGGAGGKQWNLEQNKPPRCSPWSRLASLKWI